GGVGQGGHGQGDGEGGGSEQSPPDRRPARGGRGGEHGWVVLLGAYAVRGTAPGARSLPALCHRRGPPATTRRQRGGASGRAARRGCGPAGRQGGPVSSAKAPRSRPVTTASSRGRCWPHYRVTLPISLRGRRKVGGDAVDVDLEPRGLPVNQRRGADIKRRD